MMNKFEMPEYRHPDFSQEMFVNAPSVKYEAAEKDGVAPENFHSTSMFPEYFKIQGKWVLAEESRMDSSVVICPDGHLEVVENRNLKKGDKVILGRSEACEEGIYVHSTGFQTEADALADKFVFRQGRSRETSYARDYDRLMFISPSPTAARLRQRATGRKVPASSCSVPWSRHWASGKDGISCI